MFRLWGKEIKENRLIRDLVVCDDSDDTRTHKIFHALEQIWLDASVAEFKRHAKTRFYQDSFVDSIDFDYLEILIIEE